MPLDDWWDCEYRKESDECYSAQTPEKLLAFVLFGATIDGLILVLSRVLLHFVYNKKEFYKEDQVARHDERVMYERYDNEGEYDFW